MAAPLYFLPGWTMGERDFAVGRAGLGYAFDGRVDAVAIEDGPDGTGGILAGGARCRCELMFIAEMQTWRRLAGHRAWIGIWTEDPPTPADLARREMVAGHKVTLTGGGLWQVPAAWKFVEQDQRMRIALPTVGEYGVEPRYSELWDIACRYESVVCRGIEQARLGGVFTSKDLLESGFDWDGLCEAVVKVLAINYRIGQVECDVLGLLTGDGIRSVLNALVDLPSRLAWVKNICTA